MKAALFVSALLVGAVGLGAMAVQDYRATYEPIDEMKATLTAPNADRIAPIWGCRSEDDARWVDMAEREAVMAEGTRCYYFKAPYAVVSTSEGVARLRVFPAPGRELSLFSSAD